ncbi:hypothetical protein OAQ99_01150 [Candidatus Kapabacteria bacterium]|nr:hypothetical protein [Candidatus Kapabacteria bacterium]
MDYNINEVFETLDSKQNFLKGIISLIWADGVIKIEEDEFLKDLSLHLKLTTEQLTQLYSLLKDDNAELALKFENDIQRLVFLKEGIQLCYIDGNYDSREKKMMRDYSKQFNISEEFITNLENWVIDGLAWYKKGLELFGHTEELSIINKVGV